MSSLYKWLVENTDQANAISAMASASIAMLALFVAAASVYLTSATLGTQRKHNAIAVRPIPFIEVSIVQGKISIKLWNNGFGPLIINDMKFFHNNSQIEKIRSIIPTEKPDSIRRAFNFTFVNRPIASCEFTEILLIHATEDDQSSNQYIVDSITKLSGLKIVLFYTDIYRSAFDQYDKELSDIKSVIRQKS